MEPGKEHELREGVVVIEDGIITEVGEKTQETADIVVDAQGGIVMPSCEHLLIRMTLFKDMQLTCPFPGASATY